MQASSYTPSDAQVLTHIAFVAEFSLTCSNGASNVALYADLNGALVPVVRSQDAGGRFVLYLTYSLSLLILFNHAYYRDIGKADIYVKQTEACKLWHLIPILTASLILYNCVFFIFLLYLFPSLLHVL